jgi:predicted acetyltransferase
VATIKAQRRSLSERLPWLLMNARAARIEEVFDGLWVRLFDVGRALEARSYERAGRVVLEIVDEEAVGGRLRVGVDASPDGATCRPTSQSPDLTLHVSALGAAYLGGVSLRDAVLAHGVDEHRGGALEEADRLFRTIEPPMCTTFF